MSKRLYLPVLLLFFVSLTSAEGYTVVLKNGKVMTGTLISESAESVLFKDDKGTQYSLKKSSLDLEKMTEANAAPAAPALEAAVQPESSQPEPQPKKKARVYTKDDLDRLKEKYGDMDIGTPIENVEDYSEPGVFKPEAYARQLKDAPPRMTEAMGELAQITSGIFTSWEMAASTGGDPKQAVDGFLATESASEMRDSFLSSLLSLEDMQQRLSQTPKGYEDGYKALSDAVSGMRNYYNAVIGYGSVENSSFYKSRTDELAGLANAQISKLQGWNPPQPTAGRAPAPVEQTAPEEEAAPDDSAEEEQEEPPL